MRDRWRHVATQLDAWEAELARIRAGQPSDWTEAYCLTLVNQGRAELHLPPLEMPHGCITEISDA